MRDTRDVSETDLYLSGKLPRQGFHQPPQSRWRLEDRGNAGMHGGKAAAAAIADPDDMDILSSTAPRSMVKGNSKGQMRDEGANALSDRMRTLFMASTQMNTYRRTTMANPVWMNFPSRCSQTIQSEDEMRALLKYYAHTDEVMLVRYSQQGCTACNALDKVYEWLCHDTKRHLPKLRFYDVQMEKTPTLVKGLVRFPQLKGFSSGQWTDIDFKPPEDYREMQYTAVQDEVRAAADRGQPLSAVQAEEMYFSATGPAMAQVVEANVLTFYNHVQVRLHNYWKQVAERRSWYFKKYVASTDDAMKRAVQSEQYSLFGEQAAVTTASGNNVSNDVEHNLVPPPPAAAAAS